MNVSGGVKKVVKQKEGQREIVIHRGKPEAGEIYCDNKISTGKYNVFTLLPKNLFEQFHRVANVWFLIVSIFQILPFQLSPTSSWATIAPLSLVLTITLSKDAYLDYRRHKSDREVNNRLTNVWNEDLSDFQPIPWKSLRVGNIVLLRSDEAIPADLMLLATSETENLCYIETSNLDGESNLKIKSAPSETAVIFEGSELLESMKKLNKFDESLLQSELPNNRLYVFDGSLKIKGHPRNIPIDNHSILLRGSILKNTKWILGLAIFTGVDSKLMMNSKSPPLKRSNVEKRVNRYLTIVFSVLFLISILSTLISVAYSLSYENRVEYFSGVKSDKSALNFITFMILFNGLVPISLYVTMDVVRVLQSWFIQWDLRMYHSQVDRSAVVKSGDLNEDLGQIEYVFTDKTGTLTENQMEFKRCYIHGKAYGYVSPRANFSGIVSENIHEKFKFYDEEMYKDLIGSRKTEIGEFLELLSLCHTVIPNHTDNGSIVYQSASPDEEALVIAAHCFGYSFTNARTDTYVVSVHNEKRSYRILGINEFNSDRKRMSIVVRSLEDPTSQCTLFCKGADNIMLNLCDLSDSERSQFESQLTEFAREGLRTLMLAKRVLTSDESTEFERKWITAKNAMYERTQRLTEVAQEFEVKMTPVGVTAIEDKIQMGVPDTIARLKEAEIKVWVLTGDKQETAINIGYACKLLTKDMEIVEINCSSVEETSFVLRRELGRHVGSQRGADAGKKVEQRRTPNPFPSPVSSPYLRNSPMNNHLQYLANSPKDEVFSLHNDSLDLGIVIDGATLAYIFSDSHCMKYFSMLSLLCQSVICCRVSPMQKSQVVKLVKEHFAFRPMTLAIGDGANDVSMIQEAHVGIGVIGNEGMQAVNSSDYAIARFRFLLPLLLFHGRWNYKRITRVVLYSFYKNFLLVLPMFLFSFWNQYSGTALYDSWLIMSYNVGFTALPIIVLGVLDQDLEVETIQNSPQLYTDGVYSRSFNAKIFVKWVLTAISQSLIVFFLCVEPSSTATHPSGYAHSFDIIGTISFYAVVQTVTWVIFLEMRSWSRLFLIVTLLSVLAFYPFLFFYDYAKFPTGNLVGVGTAIYRYPTMVMEMMLTPLACVMINLAIRFGQILFKPSLADKFLLKEKSLLNSADLRNYQITDRSQCLLRAKQYSHNLSKMFLTKNLTPQTHEVESQADFSFSHRTLVFNNQHIERGFKRYIISKSIRFLRVMFWIVTCFNLLWTVIDLSTNDRTVMYIILRVVLAAVLFAVVVLTHTWLFAAYFEISILTLVVVGLSAKNGSEIIFQNDGAMSTAIAPIIIFVLFNISTYKLVFINMFFLVVYLVRVAIQFGLKYSGVECAIFLMNYAALLFGILIVCCFVGFVVEKYKRIEYSLRKRLESEYQRGQDILSNLLPSFVKEKVRQGIRYLVEDQGVVTIMFCDIYDFDKICVTHDPRELTELLDGFFFLLDKLCDVHGVSKIETVNKTYMACGGLKDSEIGMSSDLLRKSHAERTVDLAIDILKRLEPICLKNGEKFQVKIGINTGPVVAGVVGEHKPQFSLVGATVNLASRMCSTTKSPDCLQISWNTYEFVKDVPTLAFLQDKVTAKGYGEVTTYYVEGAAVIRTRTMTKKGTVLNRAIIEALDQQQPLAEDGLNDSKIPLMDATPKKTQVVPMSHQPTSMITEEAKEVSGEDAEDLGLAGPVQWLMCSLRETQEQHEYRISYIKSGMTAMRYGFWMTISIYIIINSIYVLAFILTDNSHGSYLFIGLRIMTNSAMICTVFLVEKVYESFAFPWAITALYTTSSLISVLTLYSIDEKFLYVVVLEVMYTNVVVNHISGLPFGFIVIASVCIVVPWVVVVLATVSTIGSVLETTAFVILFMLLNGAASYMRESQDRKTYNLNKMSLREINNTERLLNQMMPSHVVHNLKQGLAPTERYSDVTILFADIVGFTEWSKDKTPRQVIRMLSKLFSNFDHLCVENNVYKVHTIGDCYVVLGFSGQREDNKRDEIKECVSMVNMGLSMIKTIRRINSEKKTDLNMRIGLHTGSISAGITGINIVRYDIYGPDVDIANKMESTGMRGRLHVSQETKEMIEIGSPGRFNFEFDKEVLYQPMDRIIKTFFLNPLSSSDID